MSPGVWITLEALAGGHVPAAVLAEWRRLAEGDFPWLGGFLRVTQRLAGDYPCLAEPNCGCRHELVQCDDTRWVSRCQCGMGGCAPAWLAPFLAGDGHGRVRVTGMIEPVLKHFAAELAQARNMGPTLEGIHREIAALRDDRRELSAAKARLEQLVAEGLLKFLGRVDAQSLRVVYAVLAKGDIAKAARDLKMKDSTLREFVTKWQGKGKDYAVLADLVRWRKETKFTGTVPFNEAVFASPPSDVDYGTLIADVLDGLLVMTEGNWEDKREELAELLRPVAA